MRKTPTIGSVMTAFPYSVDIDAHAYGAKTMLEQMKIQHMPVMDGAKPVAVISMIDIERAEALGLEIAIGSDVRVKDIVRRQAYVVTPEEPLVNVLEHMAANHIGTTVIMRDGHLAGIFTFTDVCKRYAELVRSRSG